MPSSRRSIALTAAEAAGLLRSGRVLVLCTIGPDGLPDPVPMWYVPDEAGALVMTTYGKSQKVVNLRRDPRAVGLVDDGQAYLELRGVQVTGRVEIDDDTETVAATMSDIARKYEGVAAEGMTSDTVASHAVPAEAVPAEAVRAALLAQAAKRVRLRLVPDRLVSWDHRKLGV